MTKVKARQVPGIYKRPVGDMMVTVINDGFLDIPFSVMKGTGEDEMLGLMREAFINGPPRLTVNAFVIETGKNKILVDAGGGSTTIYSMGLLPENLRAAGFKPEDFDTVLLTHIHPDHSSGLMGLAGEAMFSNAQVIVHEDDVTFWSDPSLRDGRSQAAMPYLDSAAVMMTGYKKQLRPMQAGQIQEGISLLPLPGHTPGHSGYRIDSAGETLVIWGDTVHVPEIQIPRPNVTNEYDIDDRLAAENRRKILELVTADRLLVAGGHLHMPAFAHVVRSAGGYKLVPENWQVAI